MATMTVIPSTEAPKPIKSTQLAHRMREYEEYIMQVKTGKVGKLVPVAGENPRKIALRIGRAARRMNKPVNTWVADGTVYFSH